VQLLLIGEGGDKPYRARYITGSYRNMAAISEVLQGVRLQTCQRLVG